MVQLLDADVDVAVMLKRDPNTMEMRQTNVKKD